MILSQSMGKKVWFDNVKIGQYTSSVVVVDHYYPFGLCLNTLNDNKGISKAQPYNYQGIELETHFGLASYEIFYRGFDAQLGRFRQVNPKAEITYSTGPIRI